MLEGLEGLEAHDRLAGVVAVVVRLLDLDRVVEAGEVVQRIRDEEARGVGEGERCFLLEVPWAVQVEGGSRM